MLHFRCSSAPCAILRAGQSLAQNSVVDSAIHFSMTAVFSMQSFYCIMASAPRSGSSLSSILRITEHYCQKCPGPLMPFPIILRSCMKLKSYSNPRRDFRFLNHYFLVILSQSESGAVSFVSAFFCECGRRMRKYFRNPDSVKSRKLRSALRLTKT